MLVDWPWTVPPFLVAPTPTLLAAPDGSLLIRRTPTPANPGVRYDLIDRGGTYRGTLSLPPRHLLVALGRRHAYSVVQDDMGLQTIQRHPWPAPRDPGG